MVVVLLFTVFLMLAITLGGWTKLQGMKPLDFVWMLTYVILAFFVGFKWSRGALTMAMGLGILTLMLGLIAGLGASGTSWFQRHAFGYAPPQDVFGGHLLGSNTIGLFAVLLAPVQLLVIVLAVLAFRQGWNVEKEIRKDQADDEEGGDRGRRPSGPVTAQQLPA